jgi:hypothetical protein
MIPSVAIMGFIFAALAGVTQQIEENGTHSYPCSIAAAVLCFVFLAVFAVGFQATGTLDLNTMFYFKRSG